MLSEQQILEHFAAWNLNEKQRRYLAFHARRYAYALDVVSACLGEAGEGRLLDIGPGFLTELLHRRFPGAIINTLGFRNPTCHHEERVRDHLQFDLNDAQFPERCPAFHEHDVVLLCEVLEHLYTAPELVLACLKRWIKPGGFLIVQTPNAVALDRRVGLLMGSNPYPMIRTTRENPGHFREYTRQELHLLGERAGLDVRRCAMQNYFNAPLPGYVRLLCRFKPTFRQGITIVYQRPVADQRQAA
jgi:2-polyprenyl-3-methyl-5-hydroxy-6-metoxy-1,4-benzoquinol methylase